MYGDARTLLFMPDDNDGIGEAIRPASRPCATITKGHTMDLHQNPVARVSGHHPLMILAALAVVLFCLVGTAAVLGWLPASIGSTAANRPLSEADRAALASNLPAAPAPATAPLAPAPQPLVSAQAPAQLYAAQPAPLAAPDAPPAPAVAPRDTLAAPVHEHSQQAQQLAAADARSHWCSNCGNIESIRTVTTRARGSGVGAGAGAVLGGLLGHQIGGGSGRNLATVAGAVGGAVVGNRVEGNMHATTSYEIRVRLDDGTLRTFHQGAQPAWRTGERVRIVKGHLRAA
jgi:outer membrane lipoprotein SlyB